jgi:hypothetical protein
MKQSELIKAVEMLVNHHQKIGVDAYLAFRNHITEIAMKNEEIKQLRISRDEQIKNLIQQIEYEIGEANEPHLPFSKKEKDSTDEDDEEEEEDSSQRGNTDKGELIDRIASYYKDTSTSAEIEEMINNLKWNSKEELKKILFDVDCTFRYKNGSKKKRKLEIIKNKSIDELKEDLNLVQVV